MTEERKQELRRLLEEAMRSLVVRLYSGDRSSMCLEEYTRHLRECWTTYSQDAKRIVFRFGPRIVSSGTETKLLDFMERELGKFVHEGRILSATFFILGGRSDGIQVRELMQQLLRIAIVWGVDGAVSAFDKCTVDASSSFRVVALLEGVTLDEQKQVFEGIELVPLPESTSGLPRYLPLAPPTGISEDFFCSKTVLIINYSISPIFHKPHLLASTLDEFDSQKDRFRVEVYGGRFPDFNETDFHETFCGALSLACNSPVQISLTWEWLAEDEFFNVSHGVIGGTTGRYGPFGSKPEDGTAHVEEAKRMYKILVNMGTDDGKRLHIAIARWIESKGPTNDVDSIIDLGIALEVLYLSDMGDNRELSFRLRLRAAWHLGRDEEDRKKMLKRFGEIYNCRSNAVHNGELGRTVKSGGNQIPTREFIERSQDLCRESIMKIINAGGFPDWDRLILGGNS